MGLLSSIKGLVVDEIAKQLAENMYPQIPSLDFSKLPANTKSQGIIEKAIEDRKQQVEDMANGLKGEIENRYKKLETNFDLLVEQAKQLLPRMISYIADMIGTCPVGPTLNINKIPTILGQLKSDGEVLGKAYNDTETSFKDLLMGMEADQLGGTVGQALGIITGSLAVAAPLLAVFGVERGGCTSNIPNINPPMDPPEYLASDCQNYIPDSEHTGIQPGTNPPQEWPKECKYCTKFAHITPEKSIYEFQDIPDGKTAQEQYDEWYEAWVAENRESFTCNNCKFFKK